MSKGNVLIGQSGGPTSVINSSLAGVIDAAKKVIELVGSSACGSELRGS